MRSFTQLVSTNLKLYVREPITAFFTVAFPVMLVLIFGAMYGNEPSRCSAATARWTSRCPPTRP